MKKRRSLLKSIYFCWLLLGLFIVLFVAGFFSASKEVLFVSIFVLFIFLYYSLTKLKCPSCAKSDNLLTFSRALIQPVYCRFCGQLIDIKRGVSNEKN